MYSIHVAGRTLIFQAASYIVPFYQKVETGAFESADTETGTNGTSENNSVITHRILIPIFKLTVVKDSDVELTPQMFEDKT